MHTYRKPIRHAMDEPATTETLLAALKDIYGEDALAVAAQQLEAAEPEAVDVWKDIVSALTG